ncbi:MAG: glycoside hydrolase family 16 protein [candidate division KSB1 bacterium]|nr:glycoside hydrolase family 16 protein [candidate division KSB1 bacterium]MDZ7319045.1 glycoside hydrolase family 16 protein [candidate division KSB1 bacterium]MDZ7342312.1 glycoside hydrolase family 16 protein [candidate division KSB1 bacterium]
MRLINLAGALLALAGILISAACQNKNPIDENNQKIPVPEGWELVWHDEFDGSGINLDKWSYEVNAQGGGNNELQYYTNRMENAYIDSGCLVIQARKERYTGSEGTRDFTSARLRTYRKGDWKYGRFDIRARLPFGQGLWPAIWMMPTESTYGGWAASGEIDIMELLGHEPNKVYGTLHYGGSWPKNVHTGKSYTLPQGNFCDDFHLFTLEWDSTQIRWYVDGIFYQSQEQWYTEGAPYPAPFDQYFYLILNVAVGGNWPGNPDLSTPFPQKMIVDYVRVFQVRRK